MDNYKIAVFPEPVLKNKAQRVEIDDYIRKLAASMEDIVRKRNALGLAAPQIYLSLQVCIIRMLDDKEEPTELYIRMANPEILEYYGEETVEDEGCLSLPDLYKPVKRFNNIRIKYTNIITGKEIEKEFSGFQSRIIQHEVDHLNGILFIDRLSKEERRNALKEFYSREE